MFLFFCKEERKFSRIFQSKLNWAINFYKHICILSDSLPFQKNQIYISGIIKLRDKLLMGHWEIVGFENILLHLSLFFFLCISLLMENLWHQEMISRIKIEKKETKKEISSHIDVAFIYVCLRKFNFFLINFLKHFALLVDFISLPPTHFHHHSPHNTKKYFAWLEWKRGMTQRWGICVKKEREKEREREML